jgi:methionine sulfoxide reductase catalytic subunit
MERKYKKITPPSSEITPEEVYFSRRDFLKMATLAGAAGLLAACTIGNLGQPAEQEAGQAGPDTGQTPAGLADELEDPANTFEEITNYNNFYEFSTDKQAVARLAEKFTPAPWTVEVGGLVHKPGTYDIEDLLKFEQVERIYRLRCVEAWSMVIPWMGFELKRLLEKVEPMGSARYVGFTTVMRPEEMPGLRSPFYPWPYTEGLRLDEATHPLTLLATGLYGKMLPNQNGAPIRLVVPWKYGFKSIKSIIRIDLTETQPATLWNTTAPHEYGFYANVNPEINHPRWSQRTERRIGERNRRETLMFNGYGEEVSQLYAGMDLRVNY